MSHTTPGITRHRPCAGCGGSIYHHKPHVVRVTYGVPDIIRTHCLGTEAGWVTVDGQAVRVPAEPCDCPQYVETEPVATA